MRREAKILLERGEKFLENAKENLEKKRFDIAAFSVEQALQLFLKHFLLFKIGEFPKTHSLKRLFSIASDFSPKLKEVFHNNISIIGNIESAYLGARYLPFDYYEDEVEEMIKFCEKIKGVILDALQNSEKKG